MSQVTQISSTSNSQITNYDTSKVLLGDNYFADGQITASGSDIELKEGMVMGRIASTRKLVPLDSTATDGSQFPVGVCIIDQTITDGETKDIRIVNKGKISENKINFAGSETLDTVITVKDSVPADTSYKKTIRDLLEELGLILDLADELTDYDNQ